MTDTERDTSDLAAEVRGLREDLHDYREAIGEILSRRLRVLVAVMVVVVFAALAVFAGGLWLLNHEHDRAQATTERAQAQACVMARNVQAQILAMVTDVHEGQQDALQDALAVLSGDPCALPPVPQD